MNATTQLKISQNLFSFYMSYLRKNSIENDENNKIQTYFVNKNR